jgi:hypothetical protein
MKPFLVLSLVLGLSAAPGMVPPLRAHDANGNPNWIAEGAYRGRDGVHCCGPSDCEMLDFSEVQVRTDGIWLARFKELVPFEQATPSEDGKIWRCHNMSGDRRCFFWGYGTM